MFECGVFVDWFIGLVASWLLNQAETTQSVRVCMNLLDSDGLPNITEYTKYCYNENSPLGPIPNLKVGVLTPSL